VHLETTPDDLQKYKKGCKYERVKNLIVVILSQAGNQKSQFHNVGFKKCRKKAEETRLNFKEERVTKFHQKVSFLEATKIQNGDDEMQIYRRFSPCSA